MKKLLLSLFLLMFLAVSAMAQERTITGTITGQEDGLPLPGVSVKIKGSGKGTFTNSSGRYSLVIPSATSEIVFSFIGYLPQTKIAGSSGLLNLQLVSDVKGLSEVIITGYGNQVKGKSAISSSLIKAKDIQDVPLTNVNDILQGKAAGVTVLSTSGQPGAQSNVRVRGVGSISASASPLYVIDGVIVETGQFANDYNQIAQSNDILSNLNPNDLESVTVLKDASALALYGSRGGNGVIVITTKRGKAGESVINFSAQMGTVRPSFGKWKMMDGKQVYDYERSVLAVNGSTPAEIDAAYPASLLDKTFDWVKAAYRHGSTKAYDLSISGGNEKTTHAISLGYFDQDGTVINSGFKRINANLNVDSKAKSWLKVGMSLNTSFSNALNADGGGYYSSPLYGSMANSPLHVYPYKPDGSLFTGSEPEYGGNFSDNFLYSNPLNYTKMKQFRGLGNGYAEVKIKDWLNVKQTIGIDLINAALKNYLDPTTGNGLGATPAKSGELTQTQTNVYTFTSQSSIYGNFRLKDTRHELGYMILTEYQRYNSSNFYADALGSSDPRLQELGTFGTPNAVGGGQSEYSFLSYLGQVNYTFDSKYSLTGSIRRDGSSRFGKNNRYANFYSIGGSWKIIDEDFMKTQHLFSDLRLRSSFGTSGVASVPNIENSNYLAQPLYTYKNITYNGVGGSGPSTPGNENLTWEKNKQFDVGLEVAILKGRLRGTFDFYNRKSTDVLLRVPVSRTSGFTTAFKNAASLTNKGFEATLSSDNIKSSSGFSWTTDFNFSYNNNEVTKLFNDQDIITSLGITRVGLPINAWFLPVWAGVDPSNGDPLWYLADGKTTTNNYAIANRNENKKYSGTSLPKYIYGLSNTFRYKGVELAFTIYASTGAKAYNQAGSIIDSDGANWQGGYFIDADKNFWTTPGQNAERPKPVIGGNQNSAGLSTRFLESNDFLRLRNVTLGYTLPASVAQKMKLSSLKVFVTGINLLTITKYKGVDPEGALTANEFFKYPVSKSITAGVKVSL
ncbi:TonB-linked SusC/RagA family outer membrane protein [Pedobacter cryoconitis]|uniref:TonB-linked SusC/RagA family outer membrane protein n=1 Tax=Pedobacter cryoconitis TaxID=188932 RepID=A0A7W8ZM38_9SPHI|nr:TonB-dependent receptor [Pedobacter cryoconitis]MBB5636425.1 TonB-linked SusC/RagA family outer membrane protein [Pedobacter cryoconitis]